MPVIKNWTNGTLTLIDGTGTPVELILLLDQGDLSYSGLIAGYRSQTRYQRRGAHVCVQKGERTYVTGSFSSYLSMWNEASTGQVAAFVTQMGKYSGNVSTQGAGSGLPYTIDIKLDIEGTDLGDLADLTMTFADCSVTMGFTEGDPDNLSFDWECTSIAGDLPVAQT